MLASTTRASIGSMGMSRAVTPTVRAAERHLYATSAVASTSLRCTPSSSRSSMLYLSTAPSTYLRFFSHATAPVLRDNQSTKDAARTDSLPASSSQAAQPPSNEEAVEPRLSLTFTCTVSGCGHRSSHEFTKRSYERGIVLVQCPNCRNRHLIADHLSWFTETSEEPKTIEQIVAAKGGRVRRGVQFTDGQGYETVEILSDSDSESSDGRTSSEAAIAQKEKK